MRLVMVVAALAATAAFGQTSSPPDAVDAGTEAAPAEVAPEPEVAADPTILGLLLKKNILTQAEYESAMAGLPPPDEGRSPLMGKWAASMYGFIELDGVGDTTQSFFEQSANGAIAKPGTYAGAHPRYTFGARNSRFGLKLAAPSWHGVRASGIAEIDFLGNTVTATSDSAVFTAAGPRFRHLAILVETPFVDVLVGQWWQLFGWQPNFFPCSVEIQGMVGEIYGRQPQVRVAHLYKSLAVNIELAATAGLPPQHDVTQPPDFQAGVRVAFNKWKGLRTSGSTGTRVDSLMFGVSSVVRRFAVPGLNETASVSTLGWGLSFDALVPLIPATFESRANALTLNASVVVGAGIQDLFSGLSSGVSFPSGFKTGLANGFVGFDKMGQLQAVGWISARGGLQYYLPPSGNVWLALDVAHLNSPNAAQLGSKSFVQTWLGDVNVFMNVTPSVRLGVAYALMWQQYADGQVARNHRGIVSAFYLF